MKNIILLTVDCFRYDRCSFNGHHVPTMPKTSELASEGLVFDQAISTGPYTPESFPGIFAGIHSPDTPHLAESLVYKSIPENSPTVASELNGAGYNTVATITNSHLTRARNFDIGFDCFNNLRIDGQKNKQSTNEDGANISSRFLEKLQDWVLRDTYEGFLLPYLARAGYIFYRRNQYPNDWPSTDGKHVVQEFLNTISDAEPPVFDWAHLMDLHAPIHPEAIFHAPFTPTDSVFQAIHGDSMRATRKTTCEYGRLYDCALHYVDHLIDNLVTGLKNWILG